MSEKEHLSGPALYAFLASLIFADAAAGFETSMIYAAIGELVEEFKDPSTAGWLVTVYLLVGAGSAAIIGKFGDQYGHRRIAILLLLAGAVGSVLSFVFQDYWALLIGRGLQGLTAALGPLGFGMLRNHVPARILPITIGLTVTGAGIGAISGLLIGGVIVDNAPWRSIFIASAILAAVASVLLWYFVPQSPRQEAKPMGSMLTGVIFVPAIAGMLLVVSQARIWGLFSPISLTVLGTSLGLFGFWFWRSLTEENSLINVRLFANRNCFISLVSMALLSLGALQISLFFHLLLQQPVWTGIGLGVSATVAALVKLPSNIFSLGGGPLSGWMSTKIGNSKTMMAGAVLTGSGWFFAAFFNDNIYQIGAALCVISFGTTVIFTALPNIIVQSAPAENTSEASGMLTVVQTAFMAVGAQLVAEGLTYDTVTSPDGSGVQYPSELAFITLMFIVGGMTMIIAVLATMLRQTPIYEKARMLAKAQG